MNARTISLVAILLALLPWSVGSVQATALTPNPALTVQGEGLAIAGEGVGLENLGDGSRQISVDIGGPVQAAFLYWAGRDRPCPSSGELCTIPFQPYKDQVMVFEGAVITGDIVGTEAQDEFDINNIGYRADVTAAVQAKGAGLQTFSIADGDPASNLSTLNGAGLIVIYTDPTDMNMYRIVVFEGLDFAFGVPSAAPDNQVADPVVFTYAGNSLARSAELIIFSGDAESGRPDRIAISDNPDRVNELTGADGVSWDTPTIFIDIPAGVASTTVQLISAPADQNPDSLLWELGALRVPFVPAEQLCRVTGGGVNANELWDGSWANGKENGNGQVNVYTFGGQAGAPIASPPEPRGEWTHHNKRGPAGSFVFHAGTSSAPNGTRIARIACSDEGPCLPARNAPFKQIDFEGIGTFRNIRNAGPDLANSRAKSDDGTFHWFEVHIEDLGEPGKKGKQNPAGSNCPVGGSAGGSADCDCPDYYRIRIYEAFDPATGPPNTTDAIYEVGGYIKGGNLQIHPAIR